ncbi:hypothetical protein CT19431_170020 [Cupriavidus taiwanensis]|nr:hypothetical protein CT19431_170020 [Cupriavidus taiwanensis]
MRKRSLRPSPPHRPRSPVDLQVSPPPSSFGGFKPKLKRLGFFSPLLPGRTGSGCQCALGDPGPLPPPRS